MWCKRSLLKKKVSVHNKEITYIGTTEQKRLDLVWFYGISTIVGYLMPHAFLYV